jgi:hypothetical protein
MSFTAFNVRGYRLSKSLSGSEQPEIMMTVKMAGMS